MYFTVSCILLFRLPSLALSPFLFLIATSFLRCYSDVIVTLRSVLMRAPAMQVLNPSFPLVSAFTALSAVLQLSSLSAEPQAFVSAAWQLWHSGRLASPQGTPTPRRRLQRHCTTPARNGATRLHRHWNCCPRQPSLRCGRCRRLQVAAQAAAAAVTLPPVTPLLRSCAGIHQSGAAPCSLPWRCSQHLLLRKTRC